MCFALPEILRPENKNLALWLNQDTAAKESSQIEKRSLPSDNLSTWLSTRYAANQTKKSNAINKSENDGNLDMWLAEKRRKLEAVDQDNKGRLSNSSSSSVIVRPLKVVENQPLSSWLHSGQQDVLKYKEINRKMSNLSVASEDVSQWLRPDLETAGAACEMSDWLVYSSAEEVTKTHHSSGFPMPQCHNLPVTEWLAQAPKTPLDDKLDAMNLDEDQMIRSWLEDSDFKDDDKHDDDEDGLDQWLLVPRTARNETTAKEVAAADDDDQSSIIVLDTNSEGQDQTSMEASSVVSNYSWRFF